MNIYKLKKLILLRHPEDMMNSCRLTSIGEAQKKEVSSIVVEHLKGNAEKIGIFSSPAHRTKVFAEEIRKQLLHKDGVNIDASLLSPDDVISHLESCELPIMIVVTHKEIFPGLMSWVGEKLEVEIFNEHLKRPRFASGWIVTNEKIKPIEPVVYR